MRNQRTDSSQAAPPVSERLQLTTTVKEFASECGFDLVRIASAGEFAGDRSIALERINSGLMDGLPWYTPDRVRRGSDPEQLLPGARSIICLGLNYFPDEPQQQPDLGHPSPRGKVARYARGRDYHRIIKKRMRDYVAGLSQRLECEVAARWYVDDGPMLDRAAANRAGLGWFGKNTNVLTPQLGSWVFLGQIVTDLPLDPDPPLTKTCGSCVRCIEACPTGAIVAPYVVDNSRCISHLTIENRGSIPVELRPLMLDWVFGCDICQEVCPVNRKAQPTRNRELGNRELATLELVELLALTQEEFLRRFQGTPIMRAKLTGLKRNACVALGNLKDPRAVAALGDAATQAEPLVRSHAAWALGRIGGQQAHSTLTKAAATETELEVLEEVRAALANLEDSSAFPELRPGRGP
jgi:epoxyqueuosine reductase